MKGISLHIGLNKVDNQSYGFQVNELFSCEKDATDLQTIANSKGFESKTLLTSQATIKNITDEVKLIAKELVSGDTFWITYSGHGSQIPDLNKDESDRLDECWICYDKPMLDDEVYQLLTNFKYGVKIYLFSDSCHSGTMNKSRSKLVRTPKFIPSQLFREFYSRNKKEYTAIQKRFTKANSSVENIKATGIYLSACLDNEVAYEIGDNGLFTAQVIKALNDSKIKRMTARELESQVAKKMKKMQTPKYATFGTKNIGFTRQLVLSINGK